jgi:phosphoacetylglucosamine mutase
MLLVETVLAHRGWGAAEWDAGYEDLPNRLLKVEVPDRELFETEDAERRLRWPEGLQQRIDEAVRKVDMGRSFVRPSGTEDCVRVYAEAKTGPDAEGESCVRAVRPWTNPERGGLTAALASNVAEYVRVASGLV